MRKLVVLLLLAALAAPTIAQAAPGDALFVDVDAFGSLDAAAAEGADLRTAYELDRGELGVHGAFAGGGAGFELRLETVRSAAPDSLFGIDGDSLVVRAKRAWGRLPWWLGPVHFELRLGLVPDPWIEAVEAGYALRPVSPLLGERAAFFAASDLGAGVVLEWGLLRLALVTGNGEGRAQVELNEGKNTTLVLSARLWSGQLGPLGPAVATVDVGARDGSLGLGSEQDRRLAAAARLTGPNVDVGLEWMAARGYLGQGGRDAAGFGAWASAAFFQRALGGLARFDLIDADTGTDDTTRRLLTLGLFSEPLSRSDLGGVRVFLAVQDERADAGAPPFPGVAEAGEVRRLLLVLAVYGSWRVAGTDLEGEISP